MLPARNGRAIFGFSSKARAKSLPSAAQHRFRQAADMNCAPAPAFLANSTLETYSQGSVPHASSTAWGLSRQRGDHQQRPPTRRPAPNSSSDRTHFHAEKAPLEVLRRRPSAHAVSTGARTAMKSDYPSDKRGLVVQNSNVLVTVTLHRRTLLAAPPPPRPRRRSGTLNHCPHPPRLPTRLAQDMNDFVTLSSALTGIMTTSSRPAPDPIDNQARLFQMGQRKRPAAFGKPETSSGRTANAPAQRIIDKVASRSVKQVPRPPSFLMWYHPGVSSPFTDPDDFKILGAARFAARGLAQGHLRDSVSHDGSGARAGASHGLERPSVRVLAAQAPIRTGPTSSDVRDWPTNANATHVAIVGSGVAVVDRKAPRRRCKKVGDPGPRGTIRRTVNDYMELVSLTPSNLPSGRKARTLPLCFSKKTATCSSSFAIPVPRQRRAVPRCCPLSPDNGMTRRRAIW